MVRLRILGGALIVSLILAGGVVQADDQDTSADQQLAKAIELYKAGDYEASHRLLSDIDSDDLSGEDQQVVFQKYAASAEEAVKNIAAAKDDFAKAEKALKAGDKAEGKKLLERVVANKFAPADLKRRAQAKLTETTVESAPPPGPAKPAPSQATASGQSSLLDQLSMEYELLWQQAVKTYRDTEAKIRKAVLANDFAEAHRLLDFAEQTIELNRRYASPAGRYEDYRNQARDLEQFVKDEEAEYEEQVIKEKYDEIAQRETTRLERIQRTKQRQIQQLMDQAGELRKERRYDEAIQVLEQVLAIDPEHNQAALSKEILGDLAIAIRDFKAVRDRHTQAQDLFVENDETGIPWHKDIIYPKDWPEITARRGRGVEEEAEPRVNREAREKLAKRAPELRFDAQPFEDVIEALRTYTGLNIIPNWAALEASAIEKDAEVSLRLQAESVSFEKALELILEEVGAGEVELAYTIDEGVIRISTKDDLSRKTLIRVYNVQDLLISVPTFRGRRINLDEVGQNQQEGGLGGGRYLEGGGGQGGQGGGMFGGGESGDDDDTADVGEDPLEPIIELIQQTIDPESWREAGGNVGSIQSLHQQLIVTQTATAHNELRDLLRELRKARALQIGVEARYITISRNWLEQIGVDLDIVLNNGNAGYDRTTILDPVTNNPVLVPRQFSRNGFTPGAPGGVGITLPTQPFPQPYGQPGLVPASGNVGPASGSMTRIPMVNNTLDLASPSDTNVGGTLGSLVNSTPAFQIFGSFLDNIQVDFLLRATQVDRRASDLDAPRLVLFDGQRACFESFIEQDYIAALTPIIGDNAGAFLPRVNTALTGRSLDVQATVSADRRYVTMTIRTFTRVTGDFRTVFFGGSNTVGSGFVELATQTTQQIRTTVSVPDGGTLLIGGLKLSGERDVDAGVPILSRIPILKRAFSNTSNVKDDQVLLILIKPTIIIQDEEEAKQFPTLSSLVNP
ncbi:MAG: hypothetical protein JXQ75_10645 [Phycisphaerae bacterium]|nr:hypothetical protein [Phycisphaerae bacterium]